MTFRAFRKLGEREQFQVVFDKGVLLLDRNDQLYCYLLYQVEGFYAEIKHEITADTISSLTSFESTDLLWRYLEMMPVNIASLR